MPSLVERDIGTPFIASQKIENTGLQRSVANRLYKWARSKPVHQAVGTEDNAGIRVVCISDTHNNNPPVPAGDILVHAGDLSQYGTFGEVQSQLDWLNAQPHAHKLVIAGNHDLILDQAFVKAHPDRELDKPGKSVTDLNWGSVAYLQDSLATIHCKDREVRIYGSPWTPRCGTFAFQHEPEQDVWANAIPGDVDVLVIHGPPALHLDEGKGCPFLLKEIWRSRPGLILFGHIHEGHGEEMMAFDSVQEHYEKVMLNKAAWVSMLKLLVAALSLHTGRMSSTEQSPMISQMVNAAILAGRDEALRDAIVTVI